MHRLMIVALVLTLTPVVAQAQVYGQLGLYADEAGTDCNLLDMAPGYMFVHMVLDGVDATAIQFAAPVPDCWTGATWLGEVFTHPTRIGGTQDGMMISFGGCDYAPIYLGYIMVGIQGASPACCSYSVVADPGGLPDTPRVVICSDQSRHYEMGVRAAVVNADDTCDCMVPIPVETSTWGRVKSLYE